MASCPSARETAPADSVYAAGSFRSSTTVSGSWPNMSRRPRPMRKIALIALLLAPATAGAQSTGTPVFAAPYRAFSRSEIGLSLSDMDGGTGFEGFYKTGHQKWDVGFRGGFIDANGSSPLLLGIDGRTRLLTHDQ